MTGTRRGRAAGHGPGRESRPARLFQVAAIIGAQLSASVGPALGAFEVRAGGDGGVGHICALAPAPFGSPLGVAEDLLGVGARAPWSAGALHANLFGLPQLAFDAVGLEHRRGRSSVRMLVSRLAAPGATEWIAAAGVGWAGRVHAEAHLFRVEAVPFELEGAGGPPRTAAAFSIGAAQRVGSRLAVEAWLRDAPRAGSARSLGLSGRASAAVILRAAPGLSVHAVREWSARESGGRLQVAWAAVPELLLVGGRSSRRGGEEVSARARVGPVNAWAWSSRVRGDLPATTGGGIVLDSPRDAGPASRASLKRRGDAPGFSRFRGDDAGATERGGAIVIEATGSDEPALWVDDEPLFEAEERDTLGSWVDSVTALPPRPPGPVDPAAGMPHPLPLPIGRVTVEDLRTRAGLDSAEAERLVRALRRGSPDDSAFGQGPDGLDRAWREAAPYLTSRPAASRSNGRSESDREGMRFRWRRDLQLRRAASPRSRDRVDVSARRTGIHLDLAGIRSEPARTAPFRGAAFLDGGRVRLGLGRGGEPLVWGAGLLGRARPLDLFTSRSDPPRQERSRSAWGPQLGGDIDFAIVEAAPGGPLRLFSGRHGRLRTRGALLVRNGWLAGALQRSPHGARASTDLWLRRVVVGQAFELEWLRGPGGVSRRAARAAVSERVADSRSVLWLQGRISDVAGRDPRGPARLPEPAEALSGYRTAAGWRHPAGVLGLSASDEVRARSGSATERRTRRASARLRLARPGGGLGRLHFDSVSSATRSTLGAPWRPDPWRWRERRRARVDLRNPARWKEAGLLLSHWGLEAGVERAGSSGRPAVDSWWCGVFGGESSTFAELDIGVVDVHSSRGVDLAPTWCPGLRSRLTSGLWMAGDCARRRGQLQISLRGLWPLIGGREDRGLVLISAEWTARRERDGGSNARRGPSRP